MNPEDKKAYRHAEYLAHRDLYAARSRAYRAANHESTLKYARWYRNAHREAIRAKGREYDVNRRRSRRQEALLPGGNHD